MATDVPSDLDWEQIRRDYAEWYHACAAADTRLQESASFKFSEDLGDFAESMITLRTFGPNPRSFDPPIYPTRGEADYMGHPEAIVINEDKEAS
jgi:hypothetical protein